MSLVYTGLAAGALGAVGSIGGSLISADAARPRSTSSQQAAPIFNPSSDPLIAGLTLEQMLNLGIAGPEDAGLLSPGRRLINDTGAVGPLTNRDQRQVSRLIAGIEQIAARHAQQGSDFQAARAEFLHFLNTTQIGGQDALTRLVAAAGFTDPMDFFAEQFTFEQQRPQIEQRLASVSQSVSQGRDDARLGIADIQSNFIAPTRESIDAETAQQQEFLNMLLLEEANTGRYNPAPNLLLSRNQALNNALAILGGQQGLQTGALSALQSSLLGPESSAQGTAGITTQGALGAGQIAANQALGLAQLQQQSNLARGQALGAGVSGAASSLAGGLMSAGQTNILNQILSAIGGNNPSGPGVVSGIAGSHPGGGE